MEKSTTILAAFEFLRRGITNPRQEVHRFLDNLKKKVEQGDPVRYVQNYLQKVWRTQAESTIEPSEGCMIADFLDMIECYNLDAICSITNMRAEGDALCVYCADSQCADMIGKHTREHECSVQQFAARYGATRIEFRQPEAIAARTKSAPTSIHSILQGICDTSDSQAGETGARAREVSDRLKEEIPPEVLSKINDEVWDYRRRRFDELWGMALQELHGMPQEEANRIPTYAIERGCSEQAAREANELFNMRINEYREGAGNE